MTAKEIKFVVSIQNGIIHSEWNKYDELSELDKAGLKQHLISAIEILEGKEKDFKVSSIESGEGLSKFAQKGAYNSR